MWMWIAIRFALVCSWNLFHTHLFIYFLFVCLRVGGDNYTAFLHLLQQQIK